MKDGVDMDFIEFEGERCGISDIVGG